MAGADLAAVKVAYERLAAARGLDVIEAGAVFAAAVERFHIQARRRLFFGAVVAYGVPPADTCAASVQIEPSRWQDLVWGEAGDSGGISAFVRASAWRPSAPDALSVAWTEAFGRIELPGGADLSAELAFEWL